MTFKDDLRALGFEREDMGDGVIAHRRAATRDHEIVLTDGEGGEARSWLSAVAYLHPIGDEAVMLAEVCSPAELERFVRRATEAALEVEADCDERGQRSGR